MVDHMNMSNAQLHWDTNFMRTMQDWELEPLSSFLSSLFQHIREGWRRLIPSKSHAFEVKMYYKFLGW